MQIDFKKRRKQMIALFIVTLGVIIVLFSKPIYLAPYALIIYFILRLLQEQVSKGNTLDRLEQEDLRIQRDLKER